MEIQEAPKSRTVRMSQGFPEELLTSIFLKLSIKTIVLCSTVCKTWYNLITGPYFVSIHLNFHKKDAPCLLLRHCYGQEKESYSLYCDNETLDLSTKLEFPFKSFNRFFRIIGCCNGLICISDDYVAYTGRIIIWNPVIRRSLDLPTSTVNYESHPSFKHSLGFGFDCSTNDYKVVRIMHVEPELIYPRIELFRLSSKNWEDISHKALPYYIVERSNPGYVSGAAHWIGWDKNRRHVVVVFDMQTELLRELMLPSCLENQESLWGDGLFDCQGLLCLVHNFRDEHGERCFEIWLMKEYGASESWTKQFTVNVSSLRRPLGFRYNGEMFCATKSGYLMSYHPQNMKIKVFDICGSERFLSRFSLYVGSFMETLVLLDRRPSSSCVADNKCSNDFLHH